jgi:hypothetical protein
MSTFVRRFRLFAHEHDDIPAFHAAYLVGTFLAAAIFNLGFFLMLIVAHMCLDAVKYRDYHRYGWLMTGKAVFMENIVDIALLLLALTFAVYLNSTFALVALSGLIRSELTVIKALGMLIPKIQILEHVFSVVLNFHAYLYQPHPDLKKPMLRIHRWSFLTIFVTLVLLVIAAGLYHAHEVDFLNTLQKELSLSL